MQSETCGPKYDSLMFGDKAATTLLLRFDLTQPHFQVGSTTVFLRRGAFEHLERLRFSRRCAAATRVAAAARSLAARRILAAARRLAQALQLGARRRAARLEVARRRACLAAAVLCQRYMPPNSLQSRCLWFPS